MWAIRRASIHLKNRGLSSGSTRICSVKSETTGYYLENNGDGIIKSQGRVLDALACSRKFHNKSSFSKSYMEIHTFSSSAAAKHSVGQDQVDDELTSDLELSEYESLNGIHNELESLDTETDAGKKDSFKTAGLSAMAKAILAAPVSPVSEVLDQLEINEATMEEVNTARSYLPLQPKNSNTQYSAEHPKLIEDEHEYASCLDQIAKEHGAFKAEEYMQHIPESFRGELVYQRLLANWVYARNTKKSEEVFNKMKNIFPLSCFACGQMLLLYKRTDRKKIEDVLSLMEKQNIEPSNFTYKILIDVKGQSNDIIGMEQILETMKSKGVEPSSNIQMSLSWHYATAGLKDKAEAMLKKLEGKNIKRNRWVCPHLLSVYATLGREDEVERLWKVYEYNPRKSECIAAVEAWGKLNRIEDAEATFEKMMKKYKFIPPEVYTPLLNIYTNHNMLAKAKDLVARIEETDSADCPRFWDALVKFYVGAGEVEKAESILKKAAEHKRKRPIATSYLTILDHYAKMGDVRNSEEIFLEMRRVGFPPRVRSYRSLLYAYVNAQTPANGFTERLARDNVIPTKGIVLLLARLDSFRKPMVA